MKYKVGDLVTFGVGFVEKITKTFTSFNDAKAYWQINHPAMCKLLSKDGPGPYYALENNQYPYNERALLPATPAQIKYYWRQHK